MLASEVQDITVRDAIQFDRQGNTVKYQQYTFFIGTHGPFTENFFAGEQDTPAIERRINDRVQQLRSLGVIPQQ